MNVVTARCSSAAADSGSVTLTLSGAADQQMADYISIRTVHKADRTSPGSSFDPPSFAQVSFARDTICCARDFSLWRLCLLALLQWLQLAGGRAQASPPNPGAFYIFGVADAATYVRCRNPP